jgi:hypothetical protein
VDRRCGLCEDCDKAGIGRRQAGSVQTEPATYLCAQSSFVPSNFECRARENKDRGSAESCESSECEDALASCLMVDVDKTRSRVSTRRQEIWPGRGCACRTLGARAVAIDDVESLASRHHGHSIFTHCTPVRLHPVYPPSATSCVGVLFQIPLPFPSVSPHCALRNRSSC